MRKFLGHDLNISSIMTEPLQRLMKLNDLLRDIFKNIEQGNLKIDRQLMQKTIDDLNKCIQDFCEVR